MGRTFLGSVPYAVDVRRLSEAFPASVLTEGKVITHAQLEAIVDSPKGSQRYYGVVNSWIGRNKNANGVYMVWRPGTGIEVLDPAKLLGHAEGRTRQKLRQTGKAVGIYGWVDRGRLDVIGQQRFDHDQRVIGALNDAMKAAKKDMAVPLAPIRSLPKPQIVSGAKPKNTEGEKPKDATGTD